MLRWVVAGSIAAALAYGVAKRQRPGPCVPAGGPDERVLIKDEENLSGLGSMMSSLIGQVLYDPGKVRLLDEMCLVMSIEPLGQPETAITITFSDGYVVIEPGAIEDPDIKISCAADVLMQMAGMGSGLDAMRFLRSPEGRELADKFFSGELRIEGLIAHPLSMLKFIRFLAPEAGQ